MADILAQMGGGGSPAYDGAKAIGDVSLEGVMNFNGPKTTTTPIPFIDNPGGSMTSVTNCREFVFNAARNPNNCMSVRQKDIVAGMVSSSTDSGFCRWDSANGVCFCPRPQNLCNDMKQCFWNKDPALTGNMASAFGMGSFSTGECISNAERFYIILSNLLMKRGKKDFAIRINYSSAPARGQLPLGPYGPAVIGGGSAYKNMGIPPGMIQQPQFSLQPGLQMGLPIFPKFQ